MPKYHEHAHILQAFEKVQHEMVATLYPGACLVDQTSNSVSSPGIYVEYNTITSRLESAIQTIYETSQIEIASPPLA